MSFQTTRQRLATATLKLKKAWLLAATMRGHKPKGPEGIIPDYTQWPRRQLEQHVANLEHDLSEALSYFIVDSKHATRSRVVTWLADHFDRWRHSGFGLFTICTLQQFEQRVGTLLIHEHMDVPPYAELLLQPGHEMAFRHPEYMLARDLELLCGLHADAEQLLKTIDWSSPPEWAGFASENAQALARTSILACFNLLESFTSGLARSYAMTRPSTDEHFQTKLLSTREPLRKRVLAVPQMIVGSQIALDINKPPLSTLFGPIKQHRDSFVHCEPGVIESERGYVKEAMFHDVSIELVEVAVKATGNACPKRAPLPAKMLVQNGPPSRVLL